MPNLLVVCNDSDYFLMHRAHVVAAMVRAGWDVDVVSGGRPLGPRETAGWRHHAVPLERFGLSPMKDLRLFRAVLRLLLRRRPQAVQLLTLKPMVFGGAALLAADRLTRDPPRTVVTIPGLGRLLSPQARTAGGGRLAARGVAAMARRLSARSRLIFTFETEHDRAHWVAAGMAPASKTAVVSGAGVNAAVFHPGSSMRRPGPIRVLFASRLLRSKGIAAFRAAADMLAAEGGFEFLLAGFEGGNDPDAVPVRELKASTSIRFLGAVTDMPGLLRSVDVVCLPTRYGEGVPRILIEAAATGLALVASDPEGCRQIVRDGENGWILGGVDDAALGNELAAALRRYRSEPCLVRAHGQASLRRFRDGGFGEAEIAARFVALLTSDP